MAKPRKKEIHPYLVELGTEIRKLRYKREMSLESLGGEIGLDASNMQKIELGHNITLNTLLKICICLDTKPSKLFDKIDWNLTNDDLDVLTTQRPIKNKLAKKKSK